MQLEILTRVPSSPTHATPLLFIHGMWHGAWCWDEFFLPFFAENGYRVAALSLRGHGKSEGQIRGSTIADYVSDVEQIARTFETHPVLIGHSMGGFITQKYLETHNAPAGIILVSNPHFGLWPGLWRVTRHNPMVTLKCILQWRLYPVVERPADARWALFSDATPEEQFLKYHAQMGDESFRVFLDLLGLNLAHPKRVKTPMMVVGAEKDTVIPPSDVHATAKAYGTRAEILPGLGHDLILEPAWRSAATRILEWLNARGI
jgi:pimeloyl-ACP methyl ester carboxylesterase